MDSRWRNRFHGASEAREVDQRTLQPRAEEVGCRVGTKVLQAILHPGQGCEQGWKNTQFVVNHTMTSKPGLHQTAIQTLPTSVSLAPAKVIVLDALRKQRNLSDYSGDLVPDAAAAECLASTSELLQVHAWLAVHRPDLL
jgi:hypothetical protein